MARARVSKEEKRRTIALSLKEKDIKRLDDFIKQESTRPYTVTSRQTVLEGLLLDLLDSFESIKKPNLH